MAEVQLGNLQAGQQLVLQNGDIAVATSDEVIIDGSIIVAAGANATLKMTGLTIKGGGKIFVDETANLNVMALGEPGKFEGLTFTNGGRVCWTGRIRSDSHFLFENYNDIELENPTPDLSLFEGPNGEFDDAAWRAALGELYPSSRSTFVLRSGVVRGGGAINGNVILNGGTLELGVSAITGGEHRHDRGKGCPEVPGPSPSYITITGDMSTSSGIVSVTVTPDYFGQMNIAGAIAIGGGQLNVTLSGYTPAYTDVFRVLKAINMSGYFGSFNATASNFDNRDIITLAVDSKAYRLSGY